MVTRKIGTETARTEGLTSESLEAPPVKTNWRAPAIGGAGLIALSFGLLGGWSAYARLDSAVVATGVVSTASSIKTVQHLEGGMVSVIHVRNGSHVVAGDLLFELDGTQTKASVDLFRRQLAAARAALARATAEEAMNEEWVVPQEVKALEADPFVRQAIDSEVARFVVGRSALTQQIDVLRIQSDQIRTEIKVLEELRSVSTQELAVVEPRLADLRALDAKNLVQRRDVLAIERDALTLKGRIANSASDIARAEQRIAENEIKALQLQQEYRRRASETLPALTKEIRELERQIIISRDMLRRLEIKAPVAGTVQEMKVFTVGGVVQAGEPLLNIAPREEQLVIQARVAPIDADSVKAGLSAEIRFPAFESFNLLPIMGQVVSRSGDRIVDTAQNISYFAVEVKVEPSDVPAIIRDRLGAGLPADVVIPTGERTAIRYLLDPLVRRLNVAMRER